MKVEIYYQSYTDSVDHWVCRYGEKEDEFTLETTPNKAFEEAIPRIKEKLAYKKWR